MNHSFNVEIAEKYGIEKAVLLENFYFWIKKNKANKKNLHEGRCYTYNTSEAFAELFPYIKERRIAQLLREMENEDNLLLSGQFFNYDRTKSYTLTDFALSFFEPSNIQNIDNGTYKNLTKEDTETGDCLNTDIKPNVKTTDTHTDNECVPSYVQNEFIPKKEDVYIVGEMFNLLQAHNNSSPKHKIPISKGLFNFQCKEGRDILHLLELDSPENILQALKNYLIVSNMESWKTSFSFGAFCKSFTEYTAEFFDISKYDKETDKEQICDNFIKQMEKEKDFDTGTFWQNRADWLEKGRPQGAEYYKWQKEKWHEMGLD
jgi:hypothetical protein